MVGSFAGINPDGTFTGSSVPSPFLIKDKMIIDFDLNREYLGSDHYVVIANTASYRPGDDIRFSQPGTLKISMNSNEFYFYEEDYAAQEDIFKLDGDNYIDFMGMWHIKMEYMPTGFKVTADHEEFDVDIYRQETAFWPKVWIWLGADDDENKGSDFHNLTITYKTTGCTSGIIKTLKCVCVCDSLILMYISPP